MTPPLVRRARLLAVEAERDAARADADALARACASLTEAVAAQQEAMRALAGQADALRADAARLQLTMLTHAAWAATPPPNREADHGTPPPR